MHFTTSAVVAKWKDKSGDSIYFSYCQQILRKDQNQLEMYHTYKLSV